MDNLTLTVERLVPGGVGLGRHPADGRVVLVKGPLPGDQIRVSGYRDRGSHIEADDWELVTASPDRVAAPCPVARECGGCDLMELSAPQQARVKLDIVRDALRRIGGVQHAPPLEWVGSPSQLGYRNRARLHVRDGRAGFYREGTHDVVTPPGCPVCEPKVDATLRRIFELDGEALPAVDELEVRAVDDTVRVTATPSATSTPETQDAARRAIGQDVFWTRGKRRSPAPLDRLSLPGGAHTLVPTDGFVQVNRGINERLVAALCAEAQRRGARTFCDFFSGSGNLALPLLASGLVGVAVEGRRASVEAARKAAAEQGLHANFIAGEVSRVARGLAHEAKGERPYDLVVVDAPRSGARALVPSLLALAPRWVAVCSCDPATLARDLKQIVAGGYSLESVTVFDMFPQTHHVEVLAWLHRVEAA